MGSTSHLRHRLEPEPVFSFAPVVLAAFIVGLLTLFLFKVLG